MTRSTPKPRRHALIVVTAALALLAACGGDDDGAASDPWGLTTVDLPDTPEAIATAYGAMPAEVAGYARGEVDGEHLLEYGGDGEGMSLWNQDGSHRVVEGGEQSPADFMEFLIGTGELDVIDSALDGDPVWLEASTTVGDESGEQTEYVLLCGHAAGEHVLFFQAFAEEDLDAVVEAFVATLDG